MKFNFWDKQVEMLDFCCQFAKMNGIQKMYICMGYMCICKWKIFPNMSPKLYVHCEIS